MLIQNQLCSKNISPISQCRICQDICPEHSLEFIDNQWQVTDCTKCGLCVAHCPQQVFQLDYPELLKEADLNKTLSLACGHYQHLPKEAIQVQCLQQFSPLQLLNLSQQYAKVIIYLSPADCDHCQHRWYSSLLTLQLEQYHLQEANIELITMQTVTNNSEENKRRTFFQEMLRESKTVSGNFLSDKLNRLLDPFGLEKEAETPSLSLPTLRQALNLYYTKHQPSNTAELPLRQLSCHSCHFCGACTAVCPNTALVIRETENEKSLNYFPSRCTQCGLCLDICMEKQLTWEDKMTIGQFLQEQTIAKSPTYICEHCGHPYHSDPPNANNLCRFCR